MVLLLEEYLAEVLAEGELVELVGLLDSATVVADGFDFVVEVEAKHFLGLFAGLDGLGGDGGHAAEVVDLVGEDEGVGELFLGVDLELAGDVHVSRAFEHLGVVDVGDDGLKLALQVFVEEIDDLLAGDGLGVGHGWQSLFPVAVQTLFEMRVGGGTVARAGVVGASIAVEWRGIEPH